MVDAPVAQPNNEVQAKPAEVIVPPASVQAEAGAVAAQAAPQIHNHVTVNVAAESAPTTIAASTSEPVIAPKIENTPVAVAVAAPDVTASAPGAQIEAAPTTIVAPEMTVKNAPAAVVENSAPAAVVQASPTTIVAPEVTATNVPLTAIENSAPAAVVQNTPVVAPEITAKSAPTVENNTQPVLVENAPTTVATPIAAATQETTKTFASNIKQPAPIVPLAPTASLGNSSVERSNNVVPMSLGLGQTG